jgi:hypothetical protein
MKRWLVIAALCVVACANNPPYIDESAGVQWVYVGAGHAVARINIDGVDCVLYDTTNGSGISCDWNER